jgi:5-methylcytosine-specific restriction endonuclease McrA
MRKFAKVRKNLLRRARAAGKDCSVSAEHLRRISERSACCPICKNDFVDIHNHGLQQSFDRMDSSEGYTPQNISVICRNCNSYKSLYDECGAAILNRKHPEFYIKFTNWLITRGLSHADDVR